MRISCRLLARLGSKLDFYSEFHPSPLSIQQYLDFGRTGDQRASYLFLRKELLVRLANIMKEINLLPAQLQAMPSSKLVRHWYEQSFLDLLPFEHVSADEDNCVRFNDTIAGILDRHQHVVETMAEGLVELKNTHGVEVSTERSLQYFLDRLYINRISIRMLMNQHLMIFGTKLAVSPRLVGSIDPNCDVIGVVEDAFENAKFLCDGYYMTSPTLKLETKNAVEETDEIRVVYIPAHLYHICFELLKAARDCSLEAAILDKNAMRAEVEHHGPDADIPPLKVFICKGKEDLSIKVDMLFNYMYTTAPTPSRESEQTQAPLAGYGYGLPLARLYARYFQGEVFLVSMEGYGTDACVSIKALAVEANEVLPVYSAASRRNLRSGSQTSDWSQPVLWGGNSGGGTNRNRAFSTLTSLHSLRLPSTLSSQYSMRVT